MLVPAILHKQKIIDEIKRYYYTEDMILETGSLDNWYPEIVDKPDGWNHQYAIVNNKDELIGFLNYSIDYYSSKVCNFSLFSFDRGNPLIGKDVSERLEELIDRFHRIEWKAVGGNPTCRGYDDFIKKHGGNKHILKDSFKDRNGNYRDEIIYEIINNN